MKNMRDIILDLREIYESDKTKYSYGNLIKEMEANGDFLSKSTLSRLFGKDWEKYSFDYENTIFPIVKVMIGSEESENDIEWDSDTAKLVLKIKLESEAEIKKEKEKYHAKLALETERFQKSLDFATHQIALKDDRIDLLMRQNDRLSITNNRLLNQFLDCPLKNKGCENED